MGNITSTLTLQLVDDGLAGKAAKDAEALKRLGASGDALKKLGAANPKVAQLTKTLGGLEAQAGKITAFKEAGQNLRSLHTNLRAARGEVERTTSAFAKQSGKLDYFEAIKKTDPRRYAKWVEDGLVDTVNAKVRAAKAEANSAKRALPAIEKAYGSQLAHLRSLRSELGATDAPISRLTSQQTALARKIKATSAAIKEQVEAHTQATTKQAAATARTEARNRAEQTLARTMGSAGRAGLDAANRRDANTGASQRMIDGMGAPARAAAAQRAQAREEAAAARATRAQASSDARKAVGGLIGVGVGHKVHEAQKETLHTYREFDKERRFGKAVMGLTDEEQKPLVDQAVHMGSQTRYNDVQVLESQRELAARGLKKDQVMGLMEPAANLGQSLDLSLPDAVRQMEGAIFGFKKPMATLAEAQASAKQTADVQVKTAKISGMTPDDIKQIYTYGAQPAQMAGLSEQTMLGFGAMSKKANISGDTAGTAFRALVANAMSPTRGAKEAMLANGMDYKNYQKTPEKMDAAAFKRTVAAQYGVELNKKATSGIEKIFNNKALVADPSKFTPAIMKHLSANLGGDDAKSKKSIAGLANRFRDKSMKGVDTDRLVQDLMKAIPQNPALANALFGSKQGARIANALGNPEEFKHMLDELLNHSEGYAEKIAKERNAGYDGAEYRREGAGKNFETAMGRAWDDDGKGGMLTAFSDGVARATQALAEMPKGVLQAASAALWVGGKVATGAGTLALVGAAFSLKGSAAALTGAAARLGIGGAAGAATGALGAAEGAAAGAAGTAAGASFLTAIGLGAATFGTAAAAAFAVAAAAEQMPKMAKEAGGAGRAFDPATGGALEQSPMAGMTPDRPWLADWYRANAPTWAGGESPAKAEAPSASPTFGPTVMPPAISPALTAAAAAGAPNALDGLKAKADEVEAKLGEISSKPVSPQVDTGGLDKIAPAAAGAKASLEGLNVSVNPTVDQSSIQSAIGAAGQLLGILGQIGSSTAGLPAKIAGQGAAARASLSGRASFSDGATAGAGAQ